MDIEQCSRWNGPDRFQTNIRAITDNSRSNGNRIEPQVQGYVLQRVQTTPFQKCLFQAMTGAVAVLFIGLVIFAVAFAVILTRYLRQSGATCTEAAMSTTSVSTVSIGNTSTNSTSTTSSTTTSTPGYYINLVNNGNAENGPCTTNSSISSPTGWSYSGPVTQVAYNGTFFLDQLYTTPGPSDRDQCYFFGHITSSTSMWQTIDLTNKINPTLIDNGTVNFNLSAWMGGLHIQDDSVTISLTFIDQINQMVGSSITLGPVLASDRANISSLLFRQTSGIVPANTRSMTLLVTFTRFVGAQCNGDVDNIALILHP